MSSARFLYEVGGESASHSVAAVRGIDVHPLDFADRRTQRMKRDATGSRTFATRDPEPATWRLVRSRERSQKRRPRLCIVRC
jgi:hypothetical protein